MKIVNSLKLAGLLITAVSISVGCAGTTEEAQEPAPAAPAETTAPETQPADTQTGALGPDMGDMSDYTVVRGDNLWDISGKSEIYGNPYQWPLIYKQNSNKIEDADLIYPGQVLDIDNNPSSMEVDAAVRHARTRGSWSVGVVEDSDRDYLAR
ncbi:LysM peptidoglycan-binding domain-containing protein [Thiohalophilus sp.]|uniref:LysM peptidoglycan-binding domain-containing protein n=1 Tax=Thiohalophilus sp. TaxID=3028392 RepID=UPI002ACE9ED7|nr:LysM peptidoglycan-binding domain-containing protein [Thiohalophilus sp.]MDZ7802901.1 LysM peptidoglycan-binding domain-containing protein [Thiohalophilus sp.]